MDAKSIFRSPHDSASPAYRCVSGQKQIKFLRNLVGRSDNELSSGDRYITHRALAYDRLVELHHQPNIMNPLAGMFSVFLGHWIGPSTVAQLNAPLTGYSSFATKKRRAHIRTAFIKRTKCEGPPICWPFERNYRIQVNNTDTKQR